MVRNNLKTWRETRTMTREWMAEKLDISLASVSRIENGTQQPRAELLQKIVDIFGMKPADFYGEVSNVMPAEIGVHKIPLLSYEEVVFLVDGSPSVLTDHLHEFILYNGDHSGMAFALKVCGDSMLPKFKEGDEIIIDPEASLRPGDYVIAKDNSGAVLLRKYRAVGINKDGQEIFELSPLNNDYASVRSDVVELKIVGTMIQHRDNRKP